MQIKPFRDTVLKTHPVDSNLSPDKLPQGFRKINIPKLNTDGSPKVLYCSKVIRDHSNTALVQFDPSLTIGGIKYAQLYIFCPHWEGITAAIATQVAQSTMLSPAGSSVVSRSATHYVQSNNHDWADDGSASNLRYGGVQCGLTSVAIVLSEPGLLTTQQKNEILTASPTGRFDDGVGALFKKLGAKSTSMEGHQVVYRHLGLDTKVTRSMTIAQAKEHLEKVAMFSAGTNYKESGHFVAFTGFDMQKNLIQVRDPFGIRNKNSTNQWETVFQDESEAQIDWYDSQTMQDLWAGTDDGWACLIYPKKAIAIPSPKPAGSAPIAGPRKFKPQEFRSNSIAIAFIAHFEGLQLSQYFCTSGVSTIGLGATRWHDGGPIPEGATITKDQAVQLFQRDSAEFMADIRRLIDVPLTARQIAAVLSFAYNCGTSEDGLGGSTLLKVINGCGPNEQVRQQLRRWNKGPDGPIDGLTRRRNAESMLWEGRDDWDKAGYDY
jgi:lysozyme